MSRPPGCGPKGLAGDGRRPSGPVVHDLWQALAWCAGILAVFLETSLSLYRKATA
jgi:hypothetical protein